MGKKIFIWLLASFFAISLAAAKSGAELAKELKLNPASKAIVQWERVFGNEKQLARIGADKLTPAEQKELKDYLIKYAADSDQPAAAGL